MDGGEGSAGAAGPLVALRGVSKRYRMGEVDLWALGGVDLDIGRGEWVAVMGPSGCGKSTLMNIIGCLDTPTGGSYTLAGKPVAGLSDHELAVIRNEEIGFIFQTFNLLPRAPALQQVQLPMRYRRRDGLPRAERERVARAALEAVGLADRAQHRPGQLSGGQRQRVAIARALVGGPSLLLADEPTGNLDSRSGAEVLDILARLHREQGVTLVMVTHDEPVAARADRILRMMDGQIVEDSRR